MTTDRMITLALIAAFGLLLFFRQPPAGQGTTVNITIDSTLTFPEHQYEVNSPAPVVVVSNGQTTPVQFIPDTLLRQAYADLAARFDSLNKVRTYLEEIHNEEIDGEITAITTGRLDKIDLKYKIRDIHFTDTISVSVPEDRFRLFGTAGIGSDLQPSLGIMAERGRMVLGGSYEPLRQRGQILFGYRIVKASR